MRRLNLLPLMLVAAALSGCDLLGDSPEKIAAVREAEGKAIGGACRHAGRAIEDCYTLNKKADKASVFAGWRDMNDYMRENKIDAVAPQLGTARMEAKSSEGKGAEAPATEAKAEGKHEGKSEGKAEGKVAADAAASEAPEKSSKAKSHEPEGKGHDS